MKTTTLHFALRHESLSTTASLEHFASLLSKQTLEDNYLQCYGKHETIQNLLQAAKAGRLDHFDLNVGPVSFHHCNIANYDLLRVWLTVNQTITIDWDSWARSFAKHVGFISAWLVNSEYDYWQNAFDPLQFESAGRATEHLPRKTNGLPPPLEQTVIDTSLNPGREQLHVGLIEAVGTPMWLGERFFALTGVTPDKLEQEDWLRIATLGNTLLRLESWPDCYSSDRGEEATRQNRLRALLFPVFRND